MGDYRRARVEDLLKLNIAAKQTGDHSRPLLDSFSNTNIHIELVGLDEMKSIQSDILSYQARAYCEFIDPILAKFEDPKVCWFFSISAAVQI